MKRKPKKMIRRNSTAKAEAAGKQYAQDQLQSDYFMDWVRDQLAEAADMDPSEVLPLETEQDAEQIAHNMLQQLEWDTKRSLSSNDLERLIGSRDHDAGLAFYSGFRKALDDANEWLADELLELKGQMRGGGVSEARYAPDRTSKGRFAGKRTPAPNPGMNPFGPQAQVRLENRWHLGDAGAVYEFNVKLYRVNSDAPEEIWEQDMQAARSELERTLRKKYPWIGPTYFTGRSGGWFAIEDPQGKMTKRALAEIASLVESAKKQFVADMESTYPRGARHVRDYIAVDRRDRPVGPRHKGYSDAKRDADNAGGIVKFVPSTAREMRRPKAGRSVTRHRR